MINIRKNLFETNSSSVHSLTMCDESDFNDWVAGRKFFCSNTDKFYDLEQLITYMKCKKLLDEFKYDWSSHTFVYDGKTYDVFKRYEIAEQFAHTISDETAKEFYDACKLDDANDVPLTYAEYTESKEEWYETFEDSFTTKDGNKVIAFGYYGHD